MPKKPVQDRPKSAPDLVRLQATLDRVEKSLAQQVRWKPVMLRSFTNGMLSVLGALAAVAIVVPILVWVLRGVQWPPLVDAFVQRVLVQIEESQQRGNGSQYSSSANSSQASYFDNSR